MAGQAIDTGQLESATGLLQDFASRGAPQCAIRALADGIRSSLHHRGAGQAAAWETSLQGAAWRKLATAATPP